MIAITIKYQPFSFISYKRKLTGSFPSAFEELSPRQLIAVAMLANNTITENNFLSILTGYRKRTIKKLDEYHRYTLMNLFSFIDDRTSHHSFIIPEIDTPFHLLFSPKPKLSGVTIGQFIFADSYFNEYQNSGESSHLQKFVSCLYLPKHEKFSEELIRSSAILRSHIPSEILEAVLLNYVFVKEWLCQAYPMIFVRPDPDATTTKKKQAQTDNSGWIKIFENIVGDDIANYEKYSLIPLHNVFRWMTVKIKESHKQR